MATAVRLKQKDCTQRYIYQPFTQISALKTEESSKINNVKDCSWMQTWKYSLKHGKTRVNTFNDTSRAMCVVQVMKSGQCKCDISLISKLLF